MLLNFVKLLLTASIKMYQAFRIWRGNLSGVPVWSPCRPCRGPAVVRGQESLCDQGPAGRRRCCPRPRCCRCWWGPACGPRPPPHPPGSSNPAQRPAGASCGSLLCGQAGPTTALEVGKLYTDFKPDNIKQEGPEGPGTLTWEWRFLRVSFFIA